MMNDDAILTTKSLNPVDIVTNKIFHHTVAVAERLTKRKPRNGADVLFKLRDGTCRFGPVTGIVDARCNLVGKKAAIRQHEELDTDDADIGKRIQDRSGGGNRILLRLGRTGSRNC